MTIKFLAGVDEVGRGCLAGPVMSAAIILSNKIDRALLVDSKTISHNKRCKLADYIIRHSYSIGIGLSTNVEIDKINIHNATGIAEVATSEILDNIIIYFVGSTTPIYP